MKKSAVFLLTLLWMLLLSIDTASALPQYHVVYPDFMEEDFYASGSDYCLRCGFIAGDLTITGSELNDSDYLHVFVGEELYKTIINDTPETIYLGAGQEIYVDFISDSTTYKTLHYKVNNPTAVPTAVPTTTPTEAPTTAVPTTTPTEAPTTAVPTTAPTEAPTTAVPTTTPTEAPTTAVPTTTPTEAPTTAVPTTAPTEAPTYTLTYEKDADVAGVLPASADYPAGTVVTIANGSNLIKGGYVFAGWGGIVENEYGEKEYKLYAPGNIFVMPKHDVTLTAVFGETPYEAKPLPEDEIGTYSFDDYGNKFYIQFHSYDICMHYMGDEDLCRNTSTNLYNK